MNTPGNLTTATGITERKLGLQRSLILRTTKLHTKVRSKKATGMAQENLQPKRLYTMEAGRIIKDMEKAPFGSPVSTVLNIKETGLTAKDTAQVKDGTQMALIMKESLIITKNTALAFFTIQIAMFTKEASKMTIHKEKVIL